MPFDLTIVTPDGEWFRGSVDSIVLPGSEGDFGVLPSHERFLTPLRIGEIEIQPPGEDRRYAAISQGFAEVSGDEVAVMVESCEFAQDIDVARAELGRERAEQGLSQQGSDANSRRLEFEAALERARSRLEVSKKQR